MGVCHELPKHYLGCWAECPNDYGLPPASLKISAVWLWEHHVLWMVLHFVLRWPVGVVNFVLFYCCHYHIWFQHLLELEAALLTRHHSGLTTEIPTVQAALLLERLIQNWQVFTADRSITHAHIYTNCVMFMLLHLYMHALIRTCFLQPHGSIATVAWCFDQRTPFFCPCHVKVPDSTRAVCRPMFPWNMGT